MGFDFNAGATCNVVSYTFSLIFFFACFDRGFLDFFEVSLCSGVRMITGCNTIVSAGSFLTTLVAGLCSRPKLKQKGSDLGAQQSKHDATKKKTTATALR